MVWAPDYLAEFNRRIRHRNLLIGDRAARAHLKLFYATHPVEWIEDYCVTFDPRAVLPKPKVMPFILFPRQRDFVYFILGCLKDKEHGLIEKSRDMGATWLCCALSVWLWLYHPGTVIGWGSRKAEYVDKMGDPKAIFPKIRQIIERLPRWMMPPSYSPVAHSNFMRIVNPDNGSVIAGEAGENMGRGGRSSIYFKDESAHYEHAEMIEAALGDNTDVQIDMSSVNGSANIFYRRRMAGVLWYPDKPSPPGKVRVFVFDWSDNPLKSQAWYETRRAKAESEGLLHVFKQEVDRDYAGSIQGVIISPEWIRAAVDAHLVLGFDDDGMRTAGQDVADGGADRNALVIAYGVVCRYADHWGGEADAAARHSVPICLEHGVRELSYDSVGVGSGFKSEINNMEERSAADDRPPLSSRLRVYHWNGGSKVMDPDEHIIPGDDQSPTNDDQYANLKAQAYWRVRARFYKTYRAVRFGDKYDSEELISIDSRIERLEELKMELSQPVHKPNMKGKTMVDKKPDGAMSPNLADAFVIAYNPKRVLSILDVL